MSKNLTPKMKQLLCDIAAGADPNLHVQIATVLGRGAELRAARTLLALYRAGMLQTSRHGGLEISDAGRVKAAALAKDA